MPTPKFTPGAALFPINLTAPAFNGLTLESSGSTLGPEWATELDNAVFDQAGRPSARKGWTSETTSADTPIIMRIFEYYKEIFKASDMPVMVYNIPRRTNINLSVDLVDRLADEPTVIALKESSKDWLVLSAMIRRVRDRINVLTGFAPVLGLAALSAGAVGYVCSATPVLGPRSRQFYDAVVAGDLETARRLDAAMTHLTPSFPNMRNGLLALQFVNSRGRGKFVIH